MNVKKAIVLTAILCMMTWGVLLSNQSVFAESGKSPIVVHQENKVTVNDMLPVEMDTTIKVSNGSVTQVNFWLFNNSELKVSNPSDHMLLTYEIVKMGDREAIVSGKIAANNSVKLAPNLEGNYCLRLNFESDCEVLHNISVPIKLTLS